MTVPLPDAAATNWVDRHASETLRPWLKLGRFDRPIGIWLLLLPGWQGIALAVVSSGRWPSLHDAWLIVAFALGACLMRAAGCAFNDVVDRDIDARVARTAGRPIPSGQITVRQAWGFIAACLALSLAIVLTLSPLCWALAVLSLGLVAAYPFMKRITWWPQAWLGLTFNWGVPMGYAAALGLWPTPIAEGGGHNAWIVAAPALFLYLGGVFWTLGYDTLYALQDLEDDALAGVKSSARRLGARAPLGVAVFYAVAIVLTAFAGRAAGLGPYFFLALTVYGAHLLRQAQLARIDHPARALALFKSNREAGLALLIAILLGAVK